MKKSIVFLFLSLSLLCLFFYNKKNEEISLVKKDAAVSGAYEALVFNAERQAYPNHNMPAEAYFSSFEKMRNDMASSRGGDDPLPWESIGPHNRGGRTLAMAFNPQNPNTLYAGSASGGLWRSYSGGQGAAAWERVEMEHPVLGVSTIAFAPGDSMTIYIGTGEVYNYYAAGTGGADRSTRGSWGMGILKSVDGGVTWSKSLDWSYNQNHGIWSIKIAPGNPDLIYAATTQGVYKSTDAGLSWNQIFDVIMATDILVKPGNTDHVVVTCGNFSSPGYGIYKTEDGGANWTKIENGLPLVYQGKGQLAMAPSNEEIIYASIGNGFSSSNGASWLCRSDDFGSTWEIKNTIDYSMWQGWFAHDVVVSPVDPNRLVVIGIEVWVSYDGGDNIILESEGGVGDANPPIEGPDGNENYVHSDCHDVLFHPTNPDIVYVASDGGMHRSEDGGLTWHSANGAYQTTQFYNGTSTSFIEEDLFTGGLQDNGTIKWNGDLTWRRTFGGDGSWTAVHPTITNTVFNSYQYLNMRRSYDGENFQGMDITSIRQSPISFIAPYVIAPSNGNVIYSGSAVIGKTLDLGDTWNPINNGEVLDGNPVLSMEVSPENENVLYAATAPYNGNRGHVFITLDGNVFSDVTGDLPDRFPMDMTVDPQDEATAYITFAGFGSGHVFKTEDYGGSWFDISEGLPDIPTNAVIVDPVFTNVVYVGNDFGVFVSIDGGVNWEPFQDGLPFVTMVFDLKISPLNRKLRVATHGNGAYQRDLLEEDNVANENLTIDVDLKLYPNPSSGNFTIEFDALESQKINLELLDGAGRKVKAFSETGWANEVQKINVDTEGLPNGIYYLRLTADGKSIVEKIVLQ